MWQLTWMLSFLPDWFWILFLIAGVVAYFVSKFIPLYKLPLTIGSAVAVVLSVWMLGAASNEAKWEAKVKELEDKIVQGQAAATAATRAIEVQVVEKTKVIQGKTQTKIEYIDREVVKREEVIKFVEHCPIPKVIIDEHNAAAIMNRAAEGEKK